MAYTHTLRRTGLPNVYYKDDTTVHWAIKLLWLHCEEPTDYQNDRTDVDNAAAQTLILMLFGIIYLMWLGEINHQTQPWNCSDFYLKYSIDSILL